MMKGVGTSCCQLLKMWVKGCLDEVGGDWEKRGVICVDYGVWGARVPSEPFGGVGGGGISPQYLTYPVVRDTI
jgi:hypothetical protein